MTGKEIVDICAKHDSCSRCELKKSQACIEIKQELGWRYTPDTIKHILEKEYGGSGE